MKNLSCFFRYFVIVSFLFISLKYGSGQSDRPNIIFMMSDDHAEKAISENDTVTYNRYVSDVITDIANGALQNREKDKPFFLMYNHKAPHRTWMPDTKYLYRFEHVDFPLPENFYDNFEGRKALQASDMRIEDMLYSWDMKMLPGQYEEESKKGGTSK